MITASCCEIESPEQPLKSTTPDGQPRYEIHGLAYVSDTERGLKLLVKALDMYNPFKNVDFDHGLIRAPSKRVIVDGFSRFIKEMNSSGDGCAILCRPPKFSEIRASS